MNDISLMGPCSCGGGPRQPNYHDCERCRLVYFVLRVQQMRLHQQQCIRTGNKHHHEMSKSLESQVDEMVKRFTAQPESTLFPEGT